MEVKRQIALMRIDGVPVNHRYEPVDKLSKAARFPTIDDYNTFINGFYKPTNASKFKPQEIEITYREVSSSEPLSKDS